MPPGKSECLTFLSELQKSIIGDIKDVDPHEFHARVKDMYSWQDVARRTCKVYAAVVKDKPRSLAVRLEKCYGRG